FVALNAPEVSGYTTRCCKGLISEDNIIENLSSLKTADIDIKLLEDMRWYHKGVEEEDSGLSAEDVESGNLMVRFLSALSDVKYLTLSHRVLKILSNAPDLLQSQPQLQNMTLETCLSQDCLPGIAYLLKISPNIKSLSLMLDMKPSDVTAEQPYCDESNSGSLEHYWKLEYTLNYLLAVHITKFRGSANEFNFLRFLFTKAPVLEEVYLSDYIFAYASDRKKGIF
ncbi:hypothetical protein MKW98_007041, partial [Papaver atlanticum]